MKTLCPNCHGSSTYQMSEGAMTDAINEITQSTMIIGTATRLCQSLKIHTSVGIIAGTVLSVLIHMARSNDSNALSYQPYCCQNCQHIFTP
ncbi:hypothetical protein [Psychrobacter sp. AOP31-E1-50]|uniref:hypothetical protein n=1 Tax=Psychrobacter sp. AOP31-E1-50 TaxID=3457692 RepID=UPI003FB8C38B